VIDYALQLQRGQSQRGQSQRGQLQRGQSQRGQSQRGQTGRFPSIIEEPLAPISSHSSFLIVFSFNMS